jgi:hypothetical protein
MYWEKGNENVDEPAPPPLVFDLFGEKFPSIA